MPLASKSASIILPELPSKEISIFQLTRVLRSLEQESGFAELDMVCKSILTFIGEREEEGRRVRPTCVVNAGQFGTAPTVYSRLTALIQGGWLESTVDPLDGRARLLSSSQKARTMFKRMSVLARKLYNA